jgi:hypothetical protein
MLIGNLWMSAPSFATPLDLYLSPAGTENSYCSQARPCLSIWRAGYNAAKLNPQDNVTVHVAPGTYYNQSVRWTYLMPTHAVTIVGEGTRDNLPVFDGCTDSTHTSCARNNWFQVDTSATAGGGAPSNVTLSNMEVTNYAQPVLFVGDRNDTISGWNGYNTVEGMVFVNIGNCYNQAEQESYGVFQIYNSNHNQFLNNTFEHICTTPYSNNVYLHTYYLATSANYNIIDGNIFYDVYGDTIRFRDASNYNIVRNSVFMKTGEDAPLTSWFCRGTPSECGKILPECPSRGNVAYNNFYDGSDTCQGTPPFQANLFGIKACGIPMRKQSVRVRNINYGYKSCTTQTPDDFVSTK